MTPLGANRVSTISNEDRSRIGGRVGLVTDVGVVDSIANLAPGHVRERLVLEANRNTIEVIVVSAIIIRVWSSCAWELSSYTTVGAVASSNESEPCVVLHDAVHCESMALLELRHGCLRRSTKDAIDLSPRDRQSIN